MAPKYIIVFALIFASILSIELPSTYADQKAVIKVDELNVRKGPGLHYKQIGQVQSNQTYEIIKEKNNWLQIQWESQTAWVAKWLTKIQDTKNSKNHYFSKVDYLRIRSEPKLDGNVKGYLMKGDPVKHRNADGNWFLVDHLNTTGWVHNRHLTKDNSYIEKQNHVANKQENSLKNSTGKIIVNTSTVNVRGQNSIGSKIITQIHKGKRYNYVEEQDGWFRIKLSNNQFGWVAGWLVNKFRAHSSPESTFITLQYNGTNIRNGPSTNHKVIGQRMEGESFDVLDKLGRWYKIRYQNKEAYVAEWIVEEHSENTSTNPSNTLKGKTIMIDVGHGGRDPGAIGFSGNYEKTLTLQTAKKLKKSLEAKQGRVLLTRNKDEYTSLSIRSYYSNSSEADVFISLHYNSAPPNVKASGINSYYYHSKDKNLAESIHIEMIRSTGLKDRKVHHGDFHVLRANQKPAVLLELGFISNAKEEQIVRGAHYQDQVSESISKGLSNYFSIRH